jgi:hypothetical protein
MNRTLKTAVQTAGTYAKAATGSVKNYFAEHKIADKYRNKLPATIMGETRYNKAAKHIDGLRKQKKFQEMDTYVKDQLKKINSQ